MSLQSSMSFTDGTGIGARSFLPELPQLVKGFQNDDEHKNEGDDIIDSKSKEEKGHPGLFSFSVACTQEPSENTSKSLNFSIFHICINYVDTTKFALGDGDHNVSSLKKAGCIPTLVKPPLPLKGMYSLCVCVCVCVHNVGATLST